MNNNSKVSEKLATTFLLKLRHKDAAAIRNDRQSFIAMPYVKADHHQGPRPENREENAEKQYGFLIVATADVIDWLTSKDMNGNSRLQRRAGLLINAQGKQKEIRSTYRTAEGIDAKALTMLGIIFYPEVPVKTWAEAEDAIAAFLGGKVVGHIVKKGVAVPTKRVHDVVTEKAEVEAKRVNGLWVAVKDEG